MAADTYYLWELSIASNPGDPRRIMPPIVKSHARILDVGCGAGQTLIASNIAPGVAAIGIDLDHSALSLGTRLNQSIRFVCAKGEDLPFRSKCFDLVFSRVALPYMHIQRALSEMCRVLRDGGTLWIVLHSFSMTVSTMIRDLSRFRIKRVVYCLYVVANGLMLQLIGKALPLPLDSGRYDSFQTRRGIMRALRSAGFEQIEVDGSGHFVVTASKTISSPEASI